MSCKGRSLLGGSRDRTGLGDRDRALLFCLSSSSLSSWTFISSSESECDSYPRAKCIDCAASNAAAAECGTSALNALLSSPGCGLNAPPHMSVATALSAHCCRTELGARGPSGPNLGASDLKALFSPPIWGVWYGARAGTKNANGIGMGSGAGGAGGAATALEEVHALMASPLCSSVGKPNLSVTVNKHD